MYYYVVDCIKLDIDRFMISFFEILSNNNLKKKTDFHWHYKLFGMTKFKFLTANSNSFSHD